MIKMVVFDMAGTTVNENNVVYKTLQKAINEAGYNFTLEKVLAEGAGKLITCLNYYLYSINKSFEINYLVVSDKFSLKQNNHGKKNNRVYSWIMDTRQFMATLDGFL